MSRNDYCVCVEQNMLSCVTAPACLLFRYMKVRCEVELSQHVPWRHMGEWRCGCAYSCACHWMVMSS